MRKARLVVCGVLAVATVVLQAGCSGSNTTQTTEDPKPAETAQAGAGVLGGPTVGPIVDIDTDTDKIMYWFTSTGGGGARKEATPKAGAKLNPEWKRKAQIIRLAYTNTKIMYEKDAVEIVFDADEGRVEAVQGADYLEWTCVDKAGNRKTIEYDTVPSADHYVDECMTKKASTFSSGGVTGDWYHIEHVK